MPDFYDITDPDQFIPEPSTPLWIWLLIGLASVMLLVIVYFIFKKSRSKKLQTTLLDRAREQLQKLRETSNNIAPHVTATRISLIIRRYLATAFNDTALFETNEEFVLRESSLNQLHPDSRDPITQHLTALSQLKYAPHGSADTAGLIDDAESILANIEINVGDAETK